MKNNSYDLVMTTNASCVKRHEIAEAIRKEGEKLSVKTVIGEPDFMNQYPVFLDKKEDTNKIAVIKTITHDGNELSEDDMDKLLKSEYSVKFSSVTDDDKLINATLTVTKETVFLEGRPEASEEVLKLVDEKVKAGIIEQSEADRKLEVMLKNYVDEGLMKAVIRGWKKYAKPSHKLRCEFVDPYLDEKVKAGKQGLIAKELRNAVNRYAIIMEGEKSVGKNVFVETIAWLLNMPLYLITFSHNMSPSAIYGEKSTDNSASEYFKTEMAQKAAQAKQNLADIENALTGMRQLYIDTAECQIAYTDKLYADAYNELVRECVESNDFSPLLMKNGHIAVARKLGKLKENENLYKAISELEEKRDTMKKEIAELELKSAQAQSVNIVIDSSELYDWLSIGGLMVFNEMNLAEANFFASFTNQLTDGTGFLFIPGRGEVKINPDCILCGTQNADYEGVQQQNEATMSRFGTITFPQPESIAGQLAVAVATELKDKGYTQTVDKDDIKKVEDFYTTCREQKESNDCITDAVLNIRGFVRALATKTSSDGYCDLYDAVEMMVINTCPVDERKNLKGIARAIFKKA